MGEEKTLLDKWTEIEHKNLDRALSAEAGSDDEKQALKQASDVHNILNEEVKVLREKKEARLKMIWDGVKLALVGVGGFVAKVYLLDRADQHDKENMRELARMEMGDDDHEAMMYSTTPGKQVKNIFFRRR